MELSDETNSENSAAVYAGTVIILNRNDPDLLLDQGFTLGQSFTLPPPPYRSIDKLLHVEHNIVLTDDEVV